MCWKKSSYIGSQPDYDPMMSQPIEHDFDEIESIDGHQSMSDMLFVMTFPQINERTCIESQFVRAFNKRDQ